MGLKLTDALLRDLRPGPEPYGLHEGGGFAARVHPSGARTFYYRWDVDGRRRHLLLGNCVAEIDRREVLDLVQRIAARAPVQGNPVMQTARKLAGRDGSRRCSAARALRG
jgi:hypothetical protein